MTKRIILSGTITFVLFCVVVVLTSATELPTPYSLSGHILDSEGEPVIGAEITITNMRTGDKLELESVINGEYQENAGNFLPNRYENGDRLQYDVKFGNGKKVVYAEIDETHGGTMLDIQLDIKITENTNVSGFSFPVLLLVLLLIFLYIERKQSNK